MSDEIFCPCLRHDHPLICYGCEHKQYYELNKKKGDRKFWKKYIDYVLATQNKRVIYEELYFYFEGERKR